MDPGIIERKPRPAGQEEGRRKINDCAEGYSEGKKERRQRLKAALEIA